MFAVFIMEFFWTVNEQGTQVNLDVCGARCPGGYTG